MMNLITTREIIHVIYLHIRKENWVKKRKKKRKKKVQYQEVEVQARQNIKTQSVFLPPEPTLYS